MAGCSDHIDYGTKAATYAEAFMHDINWESASRGLAQEAGRGA
jgi:superoxide dismutase